MTSATAPVAAVIMAGRPPTKAMVIAIMNDEKRPTLGSTPAIIENEIASGMSASATTSPASASRVRRRGDLSAAITDGTARYRCWSSVVFVVDMVLLLDA